MKVRNTKTGSVAELIEKRDDGFYVKTLDGHKRVWKNAEIVNEAPANKSNNLPTLPVVKTKRKQEFSNSGYFKFVYLPCIIAEIAWDYLETVRDFAVQMRINELKPYSRLISEAHNEYNSLRRNRTLAYIRDSASKGVKVGSLHQLFGEEERVMELILDKYSDTFEYHTKRIKRAVLKAEPELKQSYIDYAVAVGLAWDVLKCFINYSTDSIIAHERIGKTVMLPTQLVSLNQHLNAFLGNLAGKGIEEVILSLSKDLANTFRKMKYVGTHLNG